MTLLSYISYPVVDGYGKVKYMKVDLQNEKIYVNNQEVVNTKEVVDDVYDEDCCEEDDCGECCDDMCEYCEGDGDMSIAMRDDMIKMLEKELEKAKLDNDVELVDEITEALSSLNE